MNLVGVNLEKVSAEHNEVGTLTYFKRANLVFEAKLIRAVEGGGA